MAKIILTILFLCLYVCIADRVIESDVGKMKKAHKHKVQDDDCRSLVHYENICGLAWDRLEEVDNRISGIAFENCCEAANRVSRDCIRDHHQWYIYYLQRTCNYASVSCLRPPGPSPLIIPSPTPEPPSPIPSPTPEPPSPPHPHSLSPSPTPEPPSPIPQPPSVSPSPTPEQPSPIPQPPSVSPSPTPEKPSPIPQPPSVPPSPTPEQPSPIPQPPSVSPSPTPEQPSPAPQPSPDQPPSSPPPTPNHVIPIPRPSPLVPLPPSPPPPPPNHPIRPKNCLVAVVRYDSCNPKAPDTSHSLATPYEKQFIPSESGIAKIFAADCCVALSIIDNKCDDLVKDMSYAKLREFYRLEQACSLPYVQEARP